MIQRKQTLFLLSALTITIIVYLMPYAHIIGRDDIIFTVPTIYVSAAGQQTSIATPYLGSMPAIIAILIFIAIMLFRKRMLQLRICVYAMLMNIGLSAMMYYYVHTMQKNGEGEVFFSFTFVLPLIAAVLIYLAIHHIRKDEKLIRSLNRIR